MFTSSAILKKGKKFNPKPAPRRRGAPGPASTSNDAPESERPTETPESTLQLQPADDTETLTPAATELNRGDADESSVALQQTVAPGPTPVIDVEAETAIERSSGVDNTLVVESSSSLISQPTSIPVPGRSFVADESAPFAIRVPTREQPPSPKRTHQEITGAGEADDQRLSKTRRTEEPVETTEEVETGPKKKKAPAKPKYKKKQSAIDSATAESAATVSTVETSIEPADVTSVPAPKKRKRAAAPKDGTAKPKRTYVRKKKAQTRATTQDGEDREATEGDEVHGDGEATEPQARKTRKRAATPSDAEDYEIEPEAITMADLCRDSRLGRKSKREAELQTMDWDDIKRKRRERAEKLRSGEIPDEEDGNRRLDATNDASRAAPMGPQMRIVNGEIVLDNTSLQVDRHADAQADNEDVEEVVENDLTRRMNSGTYLKRNRNDRWDADSTALFYRGLSMFGTNFMMISGLFPGRTRRSIKLKFVKEERTNSHLIKDTLLGPRETINLDEYSRMANMELREIDDINAELADDRARVEEQVQKEIEMENEKLKKAKALENAKKRRTPKINNPSAMALDGGEEVIEEIAEGEEF